MALDQSALSDLLDALRTGGDLDFMREVVLNGSYTSQFFPEYLDMTTEFFRTAAEFEDAPAKRIPWYEARVRAFKDIELFIEGRVKDGGILLSVHSDDSTWTKRAKEILERTGAEDVSSTGEATAVTNDKARLREVA